MSYVTVTDPKATPCTLYGHLSLGKRPIEPTRNPDGFGRPNEIQKSKRANAVTSHATVLSVGRYAAEDLLRYHEGAPMFHDIPESIARRMEYLEQVDACDRADGTPRLRRLRQIPPGTGRFLALMAASAPAGTYVEIGTSAGYSALWIALACRALGRRLVTFEIMAEKASLAQESFAAAGVEDVIEFIHGDAREHLCDLGDISFCFLDAEKDIYQECYDAVVPRMMRGGLLIADNVVSHEAALRPVIDHASADRRVDALIVPIGKGELLCRKT